MQSGWVVCKFGGSSVSTAGRWATIAKVIERRLAEGLTPVIVCSALSGVSDLLELAVQQAPRGAHGDTLAQIRDRHASLCADLGVDLLATCAEYLGDLERLLLGASLLQEVSVRQRARILSCGELLSTKIGAAWLNARGLKVCWMDARALLTSVALPNEHTHDAMLSATVPSDPDPSLQQTLAAHAVVLTQGFIARNERSDTVLLGRGGSDVSATIFAARLQAVRCEIWTDVPGMFTANPRQIPTARLLPHLDYAEAQEIASTGARVLHPRCVAAAREHNIPLQIRCTPQPDLPGTLIGGQARGSGPRVQAICSRGDLTLISMDTVGMWQQVGFLADVFACFKARGLSVDLVSTSETNVTVSLDPTSGLQHDSIADLIADLSHLCHARAIGSCAAVSLVGRQIRALLHKLGPALQVFEEQQVHLISQAASDLNLTFVVDEGQAARLVTELHALLFDDVQDLGPTWSSLHEGERVEPNAAWSPWWMDRRDELLALAQRGPCYVYERASLQRAAADLVGLRHVERVFFAIKANPNPEVLRTLAACGVGMECVSPGEIARVRQVLPTLSADRILFTPNFAGRQEYADAMALGCHVTLDNLHPLEAWPEVFAGRSVQVRIDPGHGRGHHDHVRTAGARSKFGVSVEQLDRLEHLVEQHNVTVVGLHAHNGSGVLNADNWAEVALFLAGVARRFPDVRYLDLGGGLGVPERPGQASLDLVALDASLAKVRQAYPHLALWLEPGRYLVAQAGVLLARVTQLKQKADLHYVGIETGMNSLIRPALYGSWHEIVNLSRLDEPTTTKATVVGPICESGDTLGRDRMLPPTVEGDVLLIDVAGAYGRCMSSEYNLRAPAREVVV